MGIHARGIPYNTPVNVLVIAHVNDRNAVTQLRRFNHDNLFEFSLHIHKTLGGAQRPDLYTIALWHELSVLRGICYSRPIDDALAALRRTLEEAGKVAKIGRY